MPPVAPDVYREPGRGYASLGLFGGVLLVGFLVDLSFGGARYHWIGWGVAAVLVLGVDLLVIHASRVSKTLLVTTDEVTIGDDVLARAEIEAITPGVDPELPVLGWSTGLPRGLGGMILHLSGDRNVVVPTRHPDRLKAALDVRETVELPEQGIRDARPADYAVIAEIDDRAESVFRVAGLALPDIPFDREALTAARAVFVVGTPPVAFAWIDEVDGQAHLAEMSVLPRYMRKGIGGRLLEHAAQWAAAQGYPALTLTTFRDVVWNAPFYGRHGFVAVEPEAPGLVAVRAREAELGLDAVAPRIAMRREL